MDNLNQNKDRWEELKEEFKQRMESPDNCIPESRGYIKKNSGLFPSMKSLNINNKAFNAMDGSDAHLLHGRPKLSNERKA